MVAPLSLRTDTVLPRRNELETELSKGASWLKDKRRHRAGDLVRTYQIRLAIADDPSLKSDAKPDSNEMVGSLRILVGNLETDPDRIVSAFILRGSESLTYWIFEGDEDGTHLGAIVADRRSVDP